jgi:hypothetical protein
MLFGQLEHLNVQKYNLIFLKKKKQKALYMDTLNELK